MALAKDRNTPDRRGDIYRHPVDGGVKIYAGALVALAAGFAKPGATAVGLVAIGRAEHQVDNTLGADGDVFVDVRTGVFRFDNADADLVARTHIGGDCYIVDDCTVAATHGVNTRSVAGKVVDVDDDGVWVKIG